MMICARELGPVDHVAGDTVGDALARVDGSAVAQTGDECCWFAVWC